MKKIDIRHNCIEVLKLHKQILYLNPISTTIHRDIADSVYRMSNNTADKIFQKVIYEIDATNVNSIFQ